MKIFQLAAITLLLFVVTVSAQVSIEVVPVQEQFLPDEALTVAVRVTNQSGQSLRLGEDAEWLKLSVESKDSFIVSKLSDPPVQGGFTLDSSKIAIKRVNLAPCFSLTRPGRYSVTATVRIKDWDKEFSSPPATFDIIVAAKLWEQNFGVPSQTNQSPEVRKYSLQQANYLKHLQLYVRISDPDDTKIFRVVAIGGMVGFSQPEPQVDKLSNLHVLWQTGARAFAYRVVNPDGEIVVSQTYDYAGSRPRLHIADDGKITVNGGLRRITREDLPPAEAAAPPKAVALPQP
jgi:hypothetical protein